VTSGAEARVPAAQVTAAYSLDADCAEAQLQGETVVVVAGRRACSTNVIAVTAGGIIEIPVLVSARAKPRASRSIRQQRVRESGSVGTFYSSQPAEFQTAIELTRAEGENATTISLMTAHGYGFSRFERRTALPSASISFRHGSRTLRLLDQHVQHSPLTLDDTVVRGIHLRSAGWFVHAGMVSLTSFRQTMFERGADWTAQLGYRTALTERSGLTSSVQWITASKQYVGGRTGAIGSILYDYTQPERLRFQAEAGVGRGLAGSTQLEYDGDADRLRVRARFAPVRFAALSAGRSRGFQTTASWTHSFAERLGLDMALTQDSYARPDGRTQKNTSWNARMQLRIAFRM
jgi:hypothetical protein